MTANSRKLIGLLLNVVSIISNCDEHEIMVIFLTCISSCWLSLPITLMSTVFVFLVA